ncbi:MAG: hypothetical protein H0W65_09395 [Sphingomonas sp.]|uniref:hypothetical protein n=1 Tax=Sphingomonas sp. TaxID=28214 RepID=UPI0018458D89|nr:hypothetical protein [Sphingomonas sp.]MBA3667923.1 hypothetical protein [Sphingomonas sp.]
MNWSVRIRQFHRYVATAFIATVVTYLIAMIWGPPSTIITYAPLVPLFVLMPTGLYMLMLPYAAAWRTKHRS